MTYEELQNETTKLYKNTFSNSNELFDLNNYLSESYISARNHSYKVIPKHIFLLEQSTSLMLLFSKYISNARGDGQKNAFNAQIARSLNSLITSRELLLNGFEDTARVITRNLIESLEISLAILVDVNFANNFMSENSMEYDSLWKNHIGYGKIYKYIKQVHDLADLSMKDAEDYIERHKEIKNLLSSSVHADETGAFRSMVIPILGYPDMFSLEKHGAVSYHTANHISMIIHEIYNYIGLFINCLIKKKIEFLNEIPKDNLDLKLFLEYAIVFQEIYMKYDLEDGEKIIAKDYQDIS